ncbi:unnamed protein product [Allacma fusca]|uniref:Dynactin subunit 4 n=1 Tax=Allacma fusca TaxID=39272 RepID=A0A8J2KNX4_9HEXA|nr:unnamed protein product [Allacma fusca]
MTGVACRFYNIPDSGSIIHLANLTSARNPFGISLCLVFLKVDCDRRTMAHLFQLDTVRYVCCCGSLKPICFVYFCRHCLRLRCPYCVSHEVDSHYCGNCSENMPSAEAKQKKNRCNSCYECPSCKQTLSVRATTVQAPAEDDPDKLAPKKLYYLTCGFCRWTSRDAGIEDSTSSSGPWPEPENPQAQYICEITDYFRTLATREKNAKEKKYVHKNKFLAAGRHGLAHLLPKRFPAANPEEIGKAIPLPNFVASTSSAEELDDLPSEFYETEFVSAKVTSLSQRFGQVETEPSESAALMPTHKQLLVKRSLRCRVCERNIHKPEYSPVSIKFKIQLNAYYHVPQVRLMAPLPTPIKPGNQARIILRLANPTQFPTSIKFLPFAWVPLKKIDEHPPVITESMSLSPEDTKVNLPGTHTSESSTDVKDATASSQMMKEIHVLPIRNESFKINCRLDPPDEEVVLPPRDETSEFDDFADTPDFNDDISLVPWRKANKAAVFLDVIMDKEASEDDPPVLGLTIEYDYVNTILALENKQGPQKVRLQTHLLISLDRSPQ